MNLYFTGQQLIVGWQPTPIMLTQGMMGQPVGNFGMQPQPFTNNPASMGMMNGQGMTFSYGMMGYQPGLTMQGRMGNSGSSTQATL